MKIIGLKSDKGFYITDNIDDNKYYSTRLHDYYYDGKKPEKTYVENWVKIKKEFKKIEKKIPERKSLIHYRLKREFQITNKTPQLQGKGFFKYDSDGDYYENGDIKGLYEEVYEIIAEHFDPIEFELVIVGEVESKKIENEFSYEVIKNTNYEQKVVKIEKKDILYDFINTLLYAKLELTHTECKLSLKNSYDIIKRWIENNINREYAEITSNYDFCFMVKKRIKLQEEEVFFTKKMEKRYIRFNSIEIFNMSHDGYKGYNLNIQFEGKDVEDLKLNIDNYLKELIDKINEPIKYCPLCNGTAVVMEDCEIFEERL